MDRDTRAIRAHKASIQHAMAGDKEAWLALFADDATLHDPMGSSPHDPEGRGFSGKERIAEFWDTMIGPGSVTLEPHARYPCGEDIVAVNMTARNDFGGNEICVDMIVTYELNTSGQVASLKAYWDIVALLPPGEGDVS